MTFPATSILTSELRLAGGSVPEGSFERGAKVDGPAAPPVFAPASKV
jgi:hypothetical protein